MEEKCDVAVMEVSSQSLKLGRVDGCEFEIGIFTNFSKDHISPKRTSRYGRLFCIKSKTIYNV